MVITKDSTVAKVLNELIQDVLTPHAIGDVNSVSFVSGKGYIIKLDNSYAGLIYIKDSNVDFTFTVGSTFVQALLAAVNKEESATIAVNDHELTINSKWTFAEVGDGYTSFPDKIVDRAMLTFTPEQYAKLEKNFDFTVANYFSNTKNVDTFGFVNDEGAIKVIETGASLYKIGNKIDATIDDVYAEQEGGHSTRIFLIPHRFYNLTKYFADNIKVELRDGGQVRFDSDTVMIDFNSISFGTNQYNSNKQTIAIDYADGINVSDLKDIMAEYVDPILVNKFANAEDQNVEIKAADGKMKIILNSNASIEIDSALTLSISSNAEVLSYICKNYPNAVIKEASDSNITAKDENDYLIFSNNKY